MLMGAEERVAELLRRTSGGKLKAAASAGFVGNGECDVVVLDQSHALLLALEVKEWGRGVLRGTEKSESTWDVTGLGRKKSPLKQAQGSILALIDRLPDHLRPDSANFTYMFGVVFTQLTRADAAEVGLLDDPRLLPETHPVLFADDLERPAQTLRSRIQVAFQNRRWTPKRMSERIATELWQSVSPDAPVVAIAAAPLVSPRPSSVVASANVSAEQPAAVAVRHGAATATRAYEAIDSKSTSNSFLQGLTGIGGFPWTLLADVGSVPMIYHPLWNDIRLMYGQPPIIASHAKAIIPQLLPELLADMALDKLGGQIPLVGIYFNAICAKAMTWRLGTLFTMLASRGPEIPERAVQDAMRLIREVFPQREIFSFSTPERQKFLELVGTVSGANLPDFERKVTAALNAMRG